MVFAEFLGGAVSKLENILLLGDFNIHIGCPNKTLPRDYCNLMNALNLFNGYMNPHLLTVIPWIWSSLMVFLQAYRTS